MKEFTYKKIKLEEALELLSNDQKVYIKSQYVSDIYVEVSNEYNPEMTWSEIARLLCKCQFYKRV